MKTIGVMKLWEKIKLYEDELIYLFWAIVSGLCIAIGLYLMITQIK